ncbi:MAG TPA: S-methyl-5'-thioadenosine phosphorylase [Gemmatimonadaceae bacterium]|nr:S-methyl-5'-thioadenosine phosphorylase [Gemmatimonadaceae bacterium]
MIGIIGGTGLGEALGALGGERHEIDTPFGKPSAAIVTTQVDGVPVALLARHGDGHLLNPSRVPYRANIFALKKMGVTRILASGAVGSLREETKPRDLVVPSQVIDRTFRRAATFYEELAVHVEFASPFCPQLRKVLLEAGPAHDGGTYVCMEGPQFSTRAESELHRSWGGDLIGMTALPEAKLAREAEMCYALLALSTDYDCWRPHREAVDQLRLLQEIIGNVRAATESALALVRAALPAADRLLETGCSCRSALSLAIWSDKARIPDAERERLAPLIGRYLQAP